MADIDDVSQQAADEAYEQFIKQYDKDLSKKIDELNRLKKQGEQVIKTIAFMRVNSNFNTYDVSMLSQAQSLIMDRSYLPGQTLQTESAIKEGYKCLNGIRKCLSGIPTEYSVVMKYYGAYRVYTMNEQEFLDNFVSINKAGTTMKVNQWAGTINHSSRQNKISNSPYQNFFNTGIDELMFNSIMSNMKRLLAKSGDKRFNMGHVSEYALDLYQNDRNNFYSLVKRVENLANGVFIQDFYDNLYSDINLKMNSRGFWTGGDIQFKGREIQVKNWNASVTNIYTIANQLTQAINRIDTVLRIIDKKNNLNNLKTNITSEAKIEVMKAYDELLSQFGVES